MSLGLDLMFDRAVRVQIIPSTQVPNPSLGITVVDVPIPGLQFDSRMPDGKPGFRIRFDVDKTIEYTPNPGSIYLYNLSKLSRAAFEQFLNSKLTLSAGYGKSMEVIYQGNVSRARTKKEGPDYVTHVECADGMVAYANSRLDLSLKGVTSNNQVLNSLKAAFSSAGIKTGTQVPLPEVPYNGGYVASGRVADQLNAVLERHDYQWSIQDETLHILPRYGPLAVTTPIPAFLVSESTGLVGIPEVKEIGQGVEFTSLLNPKLKPFELVVLQSKFVTGVFKMLKVKHTGDSHGGQFVTKIEAGQYPSLVP